ncbi:MAG: septum formation initiator [Lachnospiraceae bacterium]|nr:septum formation initiator [Lachnospiraceae bacterium]
MAGNRERKRYRKQSKTVIMGILLVTFLFCGILFYKTKALQVRDSRYGTRETELQEEIEQEKKRSQELEEREAYVQTKKYIEEIAKTKLGLVNPGETLLRPNEEE